MVNKNRDNNHNVGEDSEKAGIEGIVGTGIIVEGLSSLGLIIIDQLCYPVVLCC